MDYAKAENKPERNDAGELPPSVSAAPAIAEAPENPEPAKDETPTADEISDEVKAAFGF